MIPIISEIGQMFSLVCSLYAAVVGIIYRNRFRELKFLYIYPAASLIETIFSTVLVVEFPQLKKSGTPNLLIHIFLLVEFIIIYHFFMQVFKHSKIKKLLYLIALLYLSLISFLWSVEKTFYNNPDILFAPQAICILLPAVYYFVDLLKKPPSYQLKNNPRFWVFIGVMLYFGCTLPLFLLFRILDITDDIEQRIYAINFIFYGLLFLLITKAYLCRKKEIQ